ncbi:HNH endonuclease [Caulobacter sp. 17J80-11]|nr:HNH endonuclease [Caulobacter sp. 17J80-11]
MAAAEHAKDIHGDAARLSVKRMNYSRVRGSRGHRPKDLWASICAEGAEVFEGKPQVYAIASHRGLEVGFAASISEDDYFDDASKERNRAVIPFINAKLPSPTESLTAALDARLTADGDWHFNSKTRLVPGQAGFGEFSSAAQLFAHLKAKGDEAGGGVICRFYPATDLHDLDLKAQFAAALDVFAPLLARCAPTPWDIQVRQEQAGVSAAGDAIIVEPDSEEDGRKRVLAEIARRQGQKAFRNGLIDAYGGACAISGTAVLDVLQAAHISPYNGPKTNHVSNGLLLRADLHTLFDLKLLTINPNTMRVSVSPLLHGTPYGEFHDLALRTPDNAGQKPSTAALTKHFATAVGGK